MKVWAEVLVVLKILFLTNQKKKKKSHLETKNNTEMKDSS